MAQINEKDFEEYLRKEFIACIEELSNSAHGNAALVKVKDFISSTLNKAKKKVPQRVDFLSPLLVTNPILFEDVKDKVWSNQEDRENNQYPFLQGDVVKTTTVLRLSESLSVNQHDLWLVITPSCDIVRKNFIQVVPLYKVYQGDLKSDPQSKQRFDMFALGLKLATPRAFSIPRLPSWDLDVLGAVAMFDSLPSFIEKSDKGLAAPQASLTLYGWHLLNAFLQEFQTRANMFDELKIRSH